MDSQPAVRRISECFIKPPLPLHDSDPICHLSPWDLLMLSSHYIQKGLLFLKPSPLNHHLFMDSLLRRLKHSLSLTLLHFSPLTGCLVTTPLPSYSVFVDCRDSEGARFIYATLDMTVSDILSPIDAPAVVQSFFDHDGAVNHDGHTLPLLSVQVTELIDGVFIGCSMNRCRRTGDSSMRGPKSFEHKKVISMTVTKFLFPSHAHRFTIIGSQRVAAPESIFPSNITTSSLADWSHRL